MSISQNEKGRPPAAKSRKSRAKLIDLVLQNMPKSKLVSDDYRVRLEISDITKATGVNPRTAARIIDDVIAMARRVKRVRGGIEIGFYGFSDKQSSINAELKDPIARSAATEIPPGVVVTCSPGTTVSQSVRFVADEGKHVHILTNNIGILDLAFREGITVDFTGGRFHRDTHAVVGPRAEEHFKKNGSKIALIGVSAVKSNGGLCVRHDEELAILREIINNARDKIIIVADITKFCSEDRWEFASLKQLKRDDVDREVIVITNRCDQLGSTQSVKAQRTIDALKLIEGIEVRQI